jgi:acid stress chaperone HdeB
MMSRSCLPQRLRCHPRRRTPSIKMVLTWMDGWYKGDSDEAIIGTDVFVENAKKFGTYCAKNPTMSIVNAAEAVLGK